MSRSCNSRDNLHIDNTRKVIANHCSLRPPDVVPVVLDYECSYLKELI